MIAESLMTAETDVLQLICETPGGARAATVAALLDLSYASALGLLDRLLLSGLLWRSEQHPQWHPTERGRMLAEHGS